MTSSKPSSAVESCSSSNIHNLLNPSPSTTPGGASQRVSDLYRPCRSPCFESSQVDWTDSLPRQAQTGILIHGSSQKSCPQETAKPQQYPSIVREVDTMEPGPFPLPPLSTSSSKPRMSSMEALQSAHSQDASRHTSQSSSRRYWKAGC